jgi:hypothetical protein
MREREGITRRGVLTLAATAGFGRLYASNTDFWNKKEPADWSSQEIDQLTSKSPWAKEVNASVNGSSQGSGMGGGGPMGGGGGGMGRIGGMGGGMGGGRRGGGGGMSQNFKGTVRWESAKVVLDATKLPLPEAFSNHYVISVSGLPLDAGSRRRTQTSDDDSTSSSNSNTDTLERLKGVTYLEPKGKRDLQPGLVQQQTSSYGSVLFGFSKDMMTIKPEDKEVTFTTQFGRLSIKTKFNLKDMLYHGDLAV